MNDDWLKGQPQWMRDNHARSAEQSARTWDIVNAGERENRRRLAWLAANSPPPMQQPEPMQVDTSMYAPPMQQPEPMQVDTSMYAPLMTRRQQPEPNALQYLATGGPVRSMAPPPPPLLSYEGYADGGPVRVSNGRALIDELLSRVGAHRGG